MNDNIRTLLSEDIRALRRPVNIAVFILLLITSPVSVMFPATNIVLCPLILAAITKDIRSERTEEKPFSRRITRNITISKYISAIGTYLIIYTLIAVLSGLFFTVITKLRPDTAKAVTGTWGNILCVYITNLSVAVIYFSITIPSVLFNTDSKKDFRETVLLSVLLLIISETFYMIKVIGAEKNSIPELLITTAACALLALIISLFSAGVFLPGVHALWRKDRMYINSPAGVFLLVIVLLLSFYPYFTVAAHLIAYAVIMVALDADISGKWLSTACLLPYSKETLAVEKYVFAIGAYFSFMIPSVLSSVLHDEVFYTETPHHPEIFCLNFLNFALIMNMFAVMIPLGIIIKRHDIFNLLNLLSGVLFILVEIEIINYVTNLAIDIKLIQIMKSSYPSPFSYFLFTLLLLETPVALLLSYFISLSLITNKEKK